MKSLFTKLSIAALLLALIMLGSLAKAQVILAPTGISDFTISVLNLTQPTDHTLEFDVYLKDTDPDQPFEMASVQLGFLLNSSIHTGGVLTGTYDNSGSGLNFPQQFTTYVSVVSPVNGYPGLTLVRMAGKAPPGFGNGTIISTTGDGTQVTHFILSSTVPFTANSLSNLTFTSSTVLNPLYGTKVAQYINNINTQLLVTPGVNALVCCNPILNPPFPVAFNVTGTGSYCQGGPGIPVGLDGSEVGTTYTLYKDAVAQVPTVAGTGSAITFGNQLVGTYTVEGTNTTGTVMMTGSAVITESTPVAVSVAAAPDQNNICQGISVIFTATPTNGGTPSYQWYVNAAPVGTNQATYTYAPANNDDVYVVMTSSLGCTTGNPATSATTTMIVIPSLPVSVAASPDQNNICQGTSVTFAATPTNGGTPSYQWYLNGTTTGLNQDTYTFTPANGDQVYVVMTSSLPGCLMGNPANSATTTMAVFAPVVASVTAAPGQNNICAGTSVTFTATPVNGGATPAYQWYLNAAPVGTNQATYTFVPLNGDQVYAVMTTSIPACIAGSPATSNTTTMVVNPLLPVSVTAVPGLNNVCQGTSVTFTATPVNGGTPTYQWYRNSSPAGLNQATYTFAPNNGDQVYVVMTSSLPCISGSPATSVTTTMVVNPLLPVSVTIAPDQNNVCQGVSVTFTATPVNGGTPVYQWYRNSAPVGSNQPTYTFVPNNGDLVYVVMTSNATCATGNPATSATTTMSVYPPLVASVTASPDQNNVCQGTSVTFTATPVNGGTTPAYQWYRNGSPVGTNQATYTFAPNNGDQVYVVMTSSISFCITGTPATSSTTTMTVNPLLPVSVTVAPDQNNFCQGTTVVFTATPVNGGTPAYQWYRNGTAVGSNQATYTFVPNNNDQVYVVMTSNATCATGNPATSNVVTMITFPGGTASVSIVAGSNNVCEDTEVVFTAFPVNGGTPSYQWKVNGQNAGTNSFQLSYFPENGDQVQVIMTSSLVCVSNNPATSNTIAMIVNPTVTVTATITAEENGLCAGEQMSFSATTTNGGNSPVYQWQVNGNNAGTNSPDFSYIPVNNDVVNLVFTSSLYCTVANPVTSNNITASVNALPVVTWPSYEYPTLCINWPPVELSGGLPAGGDYSGQGVENNMFSPGVVGVGTYELTYTYTDDNGCVGTAVFTVTVDECVGTENPALNASSVVLYPNPVSDRLFMKYNNQFNLETIRIINNTGNLVIETNQTGNISQSGIYVGQLSPGIYTLQAIFGNGIINKVFVVK